MSPKDKVLTVMENLPETRLCELLDFARFLFWLEKQQKEESRDWLGFGMEQFAQAYGPDEPDYSESDIIRPEPNS